ncbi:unnamed protein product [Mesocestoides corti]|uniref:RGS domain-containing protein n=1 Tax=Mesocestoides corti TaxID=53468 RepID=A0A158QTC6_MESCO|nr:unnamed protein product [Mesocestoides corti]
MSYPPGSLRSCHEADGRSDRSGGSGGTGSGSGCGNIYGSIYNAFSEYKLHQSDSSNPASNSAWQKWSASFDALLSDGEGVALFKAYLESEGCGNLLDFWFAVQGFRSKVDPSDRKKVLQLIKVIYQTYIRGSSSTTAPPPSSTSSSSRCRRNHAPVRLRQETRRAIADRLSHKSSLDQTVFDEAQQEVGHLLRNTAYQAFLKSDAFIAHIQQGSGFPPESSIPRHAFGSPVYPGSLPTVEEDRELGVEKPPGKGSVTPASSTYHCFCGPQVLLPQQQQQAHIQLCSCQINSQWSVPYQPQGCYPQAAPLTQENLQITRFQRAELPVPQHLSSCPHCHTPYQQPVAPSNPLSPAQHKPTGRFGASSQRKWMDAVWTRYIAPYHTPLSSLCTEQRFFPGSSPRWASLVKARILHANKTRPTLAVNQRWKACQKCYAGGSAKTCSGRQCAITGVFSVYHDPPPVVGSRRRRCLMTRGGSAPQITIRRALISVWCVRGKESEVTGDGEVKSASMPDPLLPWHTKFPQSIASPKHDYFSSPGLGGGFARPPPNPYHVSFAPVSTQDSEHHSISSGTHTEESLSHTDGTCDDSRLRMHFLMRHAPRMPATQAAPPTNYPVFEPTPPPPPPLNTSTSIRGTNCKHKRGSSATRKGTATTTSATNMGKAVTIRAQNMAELDPTAFAKLLNERLQRVVEDRAATELLEKLMTDIGIVSSLSMQETLLSLKVGKNEEGEEGEVVEGDHAVEANGDAGRLASAPTVEASTNSCETRSQPATEAAPNPTTRPGSQALEASAKPSVLQRPWADRLLAAARVQHAEHGDNAQAILEDHCSRIWATSADRTPTSGSGSGESADIQRRSGPPQPTTGLLPPDEMEEEEEEEDDCVRPQLLQESTPPSLTTQPPSQFPSRFDFHQQVNETQLVASRSVGDRLQDGIALRHQTAMPLHRSGHADPLTATAATATGIAARRRLATLPPCSSTARVRVCALSPINATHFSGSGGFKSTYATAPSHPPPAKSPQPPPHLSTSTTSSTSGSGGGGGLVVGYYLCDDPVPYRSQWPSHEITLGQFKHLVPKKGLFRFFFKTTSDEFDSGVVHQEISNDDAILPLWEGKVVAKIERVEQ